MSIKLEFYIKNQTEYEQFLTQPNKDLKKMASVEDDKKQYALYRHRCFYELYEYEIVGKDYITVDVTEGSRIIEKADGDFEQFVNLMLRLML